jgi:hypothetical protein
MEKKTYDMRGKQSNISRLARFDLEGFIHMLFYRIQIFYSVIYGLAMLYYLITGIDFGLKLLTIIFWVLITPQLWETIKAFSLISSRGLAFGHLSEEHVYLMKSKYSKTGSVYSIIPYAAMLFWVLGFIAMLMWWSL